MDELIAAMRAACDPARSKSLSTYFGTRRYLGLTAVAARRVAYVFAERWTLQRIAKLLAGDVREHRFVALEMLVRRYETGTASARREIAQLYLRNLRFVDHWVLIDTSAPYLLGEHRAILFELAASTNPSRRRVAMVASWASIKARRFDDAIRLAAILRDDVDPMVQRAVGWMLREVGKRSRRALARFLDDHATSMLRPTLRSAVDQLPVALRRRYLRAGARR